MNWGVVITVHFLVNFCVAEIQSEPSSFIVEHSFDHGKTFTEKIVISTTNPDEPYSLSHESPLTALESDSLQTLIIQNGLYKVRSPINEKSYIHGSVASCHIASSEGKLAITLSLDASGHPIALSLVPRNQTCNGELRILRELSTIVMVQRPILAMGPETKEYLTKLDRQREEKVRQEQQDNRSFLAKYWMYIVPAVFFLMLMNSAGPNSNGAAE